MEPPARADITSTSNSRGYRHGSCLRNNRADSGRGRPDATQVMWAVGHNGGHLRDERFVAVHRGGPLDLDRHRLLAIWAADCAEHVLPLFTQASPNDQPRRAVDQARSWALGQVSVGDARQAAFSVHEAAREVEDAAASAAARSAGHAAATAHMADHCVWAAVYALKATQAAGGNPDSEREWQEERLPAEVRELVLSTQREPQGPCAQPAD